MSNLNENNYDLYNIQPKKCFTKLNINGNINKNSNQNGANKKEISNYNRLDTNSNSNTKNNNSFNNSTSRAISITERINKRKKIPKYPICQFKIQAHDLEVITNRLKHDSDINEALLELERDQHLMLTSYRYEDKLKHQSNGTAPMEYVKEANDDNINNIKNNNKEIQTEKRVVNNPFIKARENLKQFIKQNTKNKLSKCEEDNEKQSDDIVNREEREDIIDKKLKPNINIRNVNNVKELSNPGKNKRVLKFSDYSNQYNDVIIKPSSCHFKTNSNSDTYYNNTFNSQILSHIPHSTFFYLKKYKYNYIQHLVQLIDNIIYNTKAKLFIDHIKVSKEYIETEVTIIKSKRTITKELSISSINTTFPSNRPSACISTFKTNTKENNTYNHLSLNQEDQLIEQHTPKPQISYITVNELVSDDQRSINSSRNCINQYEKSLSQIQQIAKETKDLELNIKKFTKTILSN